MGQAYTKKHSNFMQFHPGSMYVRRFFNPRAKQEMIEMTSYIKKVFKEELTDELDWMDDKTKTRKLFQKIQLKRSVLSYL